MSSQGLQITLDPHIRHAKVEAKVICPYKIFKLFDNSTFYFKSQIILHNFLSQSLFS